MIDTNVNRQHGNNVKWSVIKDDDQLLPMTVADMGIATPQFIREAMQRVLDTKVLGYTMPSTGFYDAIIRWQKEHHDVTLKREQLILVPSVAVGLSFAIRHLTQVDDGIIVMSPYYPPYKQLVDDNHRQFVEFPLVQREGQYVIDFNRLDQLMTDSQAKAIIVCNPHNPGGCVWTTTELQRLEDIANAHHMLVLADEIHDDVAFSDNVPVSMMSDLMGEEAASQTILLKSATKAFNLAGVKCAYLAVKDPQMLTTLKQAAAAEAIEEVNTLGMVATQTAYEQGSEWLTEVNAYLEENRNLAYEYLREQVPMIRPMYPEGTYLIWLDFMAYGLSDAELDTKLRDLGHLCLNPGIDYGKTGKGFMRLNFAVDRSVLKDALHRLKHFDESVRQK
ncbi:putative C-S lyase [Lactobacillus sp. LC28-10]|uniref:cysteine-S-conjugate beta-lyase n=1 Tax=Secundilactobacillus angelensis TaxID=2722706 RepID=A0ABX1KZJ5_9LACO|nr:PatB family C-S lyase [Secundilactobacillus angelensis]MCH5461529.1 PatB family C-S lyase [Secundilactobacillus angelensis]NLR19364.1 putative C-S lyase [Secundilactobacillus angelensis]